MGQIEQEDENLIEIKMKLTGNDEFSVNLPDNINIFDLKNFIGEIMQVDGRKIKLITKGKILKDDQSIDVYGIKNGDSIVVIVNNCKDPSLLLAVVMDIWYSESGGGEEAQPD